MLYIIYYCIMNVFPNLDEAIGLMSRVFANGPGDLGSFNPKYWKNGTWYRFA